MDKNTNNSVAVKTDPVDREAMTEEERKVLLDRFREVADRIGERNKDLDPDEVLAEVTAVVEEVRQERYEREQREAKERG